MKNRIIIIGGGPAGLMAAGQAARSRNQVVLFEKMSQVGKKLSISGKGRCNLTNTAPLDTFLSRFNRSGRFLRQPFGQFFNSDLQLFFGNLGISLEAQRGGRVFPKSGRASEIVEALTSWVKRSGVEVHSGQPIAGLCLDQDKVAGVTTGDGRQIDGQAVILATGGASYPATGSTGDGYQMAQQAGHTVIAPKPALVPLITKENVSSLAGLDVKNTALRVFINGKRKVNDFGEISFNRTGIGGPLVLSHSRMIVEALNKNRQVEVMIDLKPALDEAALEKRVQRDLTSRHKEELQSLLRGLLPRPLVSHYLAHAGLQPTIKGGDISSRERKRLVQWLKNVKFSIAGHRPLAEAMVTSGGVNVKEISPDTMESRLVHGLYFAGEIIDVDGETGGYNLQAAFSTGWVAGKAAATR